MERNQLFSLCWKDVASKQNQIFNDLWQKGEQLDVTVICGLKTFYAHRIVLSASSTYFRQTLKDVSTNGNAVLLLPTIDPEIFAGLLQFIYSGEVSVEESQLKTFLDTANTLKIGGIHSESHSNGLTEESLLKTTDNASISILNDTDREWESNEHSPFVDQSRASASPCNIKCEVVDDMVTESDEHTQMYDCESDSMTYQPAEYPKSASGSFEDSLVYYKSQVEVTCESSESSSSAAAIRRPFNLPNLTVETAKLHKPMPIQTYRRCANCSIKKKQRRSRIMCAVCQVVLCSDCFTWCHRVEIS